MTFDIFKSKNEFIVGIFFLLAMLQIFLAGSIPTTSYPLFLNGSKKVPSLLAISTTKGFFYFSHLLIFYKHLC